MGFLGMLAGKKLFGTVVGERGSRAIMGIATALMILLLFVGSAWFLRHDAFNDGQRVERAAWEKKAADLKAEAEKLQRHADQLRASAETVDRDRIATNRKEVDDATSNIPDQRTSPRQHARACIELRRQGQNPAACQSQPAR